MENQMLEVNSEDLDKIIKVHYEGLGFCLITMICTTVTGWFCYHLDFFKEFTLSSLVTFVIIAGFYFIPDDKHYFWLRYFMIACFGFCGGQVLCPCIEEDLKFMDRTTIETSMFFTGLCLIGLWLAAYYLHKIEYTFRRTTLDFISYAKSAFVVANFWLDIKVLKCGLAFLDLFLDAGSFVYDTKDIMDNVRTNENVTGQALTYYFHLVDILQQVFSIIQAESELQNCDF